MAAALTAESFTKLLTGLERAGEKYEALRRTLIKFFEWRGTPFPEDHADETLNRTRYLFGELSDAEQAQLEGASEAARPSPRASNQCS